MLHLLAIARSAGVDLELDDFQASSDRTPFLADLKPSGRFVMEDVHKAPPAPSLHLCLMECELSAWYGSSSLPHQGGAPCASRTRHDRHATEYLARHSVTSRWVAHSYVLLIIKGNSAEPATSA